MVKADGRRLQVAAIGLGVDSVAMALELASRGEEVDLMLFADTGGERPETYAYLPVFRAWAAAAGRGIPFEVVSYRPRDLRGGPGYGSLEENCAKDGVLPSRVYGAGQCSAKWKIQPQDAFVAGWAPARAEWEAGRRVVKMIGYDCSPGDERRHARREGREDPRYEMRYPLREWGWVRADCERRILAEGMPLPTKSACFFCPVTKPHEVSSLPGRELRRIVLMEARAEPRLTAAIEGLWRKPVKGMRGATRRPGSMTRWIVDEGLLPAAEVAAIRDRVAPALGEWVEAVRAAGGPQEGRAGLGGWFAAFDALGEAGFPDAGVRGLREAGAGAGAGAGAVAAVGRRRP